MAKLFNGMIPFASAIKPTGAQPLDDRTVVKSFSDLLSDETFGLAKYNGMLVAVLDDEQVYMLIDDKNSSSEASWVAVGSDNGSLAVETYAEALELATNDNIGQLIYVKTKSSYDADGEEGEGEAVEYDKAPYIVIGEKNLVEIVTSLKLDKEIETINKTIVDNEQVTSEALNKLNTDLKNLKFPVTDVKVNNTSVLNTETGVANIDLTGIQQDITDLENDKVSKVEGSRLMSETEGTKLAGIAEGAQVNVIESVKVNGTALSINEKSVNIEIESIKVKGVDGADKMLTLSESGEVKSELSIKYVSAEESSDKKPYIALYGKNGTTLIDTLDATQFVKDGMISSVDLIDTADNKKALQIVWNTDAGKETVDLDVTELIDYYYAGDGITFDDKTRKFSIDLIDNSLLKVDASGLGVDATALWSAADAKYDAKNSASQALTDAKAYTDTEVGKALTSAKDYTDELSDKVYTKTDADATFVKTANFNEFSQELETKLEGIAAGAQVNVIESLTVNGVDATVGTDKKATVTVSAGDITIGSAIKDGADSNVVKYESTAKISEVLQGIQNSVVAANTTLNGTVKSVTNKDASIVVDNTDANNPTVKVKISEEANNLLSLKNDGLFVAMYYDGDDAE